MGDRVLGSTSGAEITNHPRQLSLAIPPWVGTMSTSQRAVMLCGWGVKAGTVRERVAGKTVWLLCDTLLCEHNYMQTKWNDNTFISCKYRPSWHIRWRVVWGAGVEPFMPSSLTATCRVITSVTCLLKHACMAQLYAGFVSDSTFLWCLL